MAYSAAELRMVDDHIAQGERHVHRQRELVAWLKSRGHPTDMAEDLLAQFEASLLQHREHRAKMLREREDDPLRPGPTAPAEPPASKPPKRG